MSLSQVRRLNVVIIFLSKMEDIALSMFPFLIFKISQFFLIKKEIDQVQKLVRLKFAKIMKLNTKVVSQKETQFN